MRCVSSPCRRAVIVGEYHTTRYLILTLSTNMTLIAYIGAHSDRNTSNWIASTATTRLAPLTPPV